MLDIVLQVAVSAIAGAVVGAAAGYGVAAIIEVLSKPFSKLWKNLVAGVKEIWGYATEATQYYLALISRFLNENWSEIESYLRQEFGYCRNWLIGVFRHGLNTVIAFVDPKHQSQSPVIISVPLEDQNEIQLPTEQVMVSELSLS